MKRHEVLDLNDGSEIPDLNGQLCNEEPDYEPDYEEEDEQEDAPEPGAVSVAHPEPSPSIAANGVRSQPAALVADVHRETPASQQTQREAMPDNGRPGVNRSGEGMNGATLDTVISMLDALTLDELEALSDKVQSAAESKRKAELGEKPIHAGWFKVSHYDISKMLKHAPHKLRTVSVWIWLLKIANERKRIEFQIAVEDVGYLFAVDRRTIRAALEDLRDGGMIDLAISERSASTGRYKPAHIKLHAYTSPVSSTKMGKTMYKKCTG